jgi:hypothetical protein
MVTLGDNIILAVYKEMDWEPPYNCTTGILAIDFGRSDRIYKCFGRATVNSLAILSYFSLSEFRIN